jgi:lysozyme
VAAPDPVGIPTECRGHTAGVVIGHRPTSAECDAEFWSDMWNAYQGEQQCIHVSTTPGQTIALMDMVFNGGKRMLCRSTLARMANAGKPASAWCPQFKRFVYAKGRKLRGLVRRANARYSLCLKT